MAYLAYEFEQHLHCTAIFLLDGEHAVHCNDVRLDPVQYVIR